MYNSLRIKSNENNRSKRGRELDEAKVVLCHFACSCQEFPVAELTSFSETSRERAFERFELLRIHFEGGRPLSTIARKPSFAAESDYSP